MVVVQAGCCCWSINHRAKERQLCSVARTTVQWLAGATLACMCVKNGQPKKSHRRDRLLVFCFVFVVVVHFGLCFWCFQSLFVCVCFLKFNGHKSIRPPMLLLLLSVPTLCETGNCVLKSLQHCCLLAIICFCVFLF